MYSEKYPNEPVKLGYFRGYVNSNYNIAFGTPMTDVCSTCIKAKETLKNAITLEEKIQIITEQRVHTLKSRAFYNLLKIEENNVQIFSFDCQKNLSLPKLPDQAAYFSQQINYYNLTIVKGSSKSKLTANNVFSYLWAETDSPKDSNAITSAVHHLLKNATFSNTIDTTIICRRVRRSKQKFCYDVHDRVLARFGSSCPYKNCGIYLYNSGTFLCTSRPNFWAN